MRFFNICFWVVFLPYLSFGQELPIWENNVHVYNRFTIGKDFQNAFPVQIESNGSLVVHPYSKSVYSIGNHSYSEVVSNPTGKGFLLKIHHFKNSTVFLYHSSVILKQSTKESSLLDVKEEYFVEGVSYFNSSELYFSIGFINNNERVIYRYDGQKLEKIITFKSKNHLRLISLNNEIHTVENDRNNNKTLLFKIKSGKLIPLKEYPWACNYFHFKSEEDVFFGIDNKLFHYTNGKLSKINESNKGNDYHTSDYYHYNKNNFSIFYNPTKHFTPEFFTATEDNVHQNFYSPASASLYFGTGNHLMRAFKYLKKYPRLYNNTNSGQIFSLTQTADGKIWAGSYNGNISIVDNDKVVESKIHEYKIMNGGFALGKKVVLNTEYTKGVLLFNELNQYKKISDTISSYYNYLSRDSMFYVGTTSYGLMYKHLKDIENINVKWKFIGRDKGIHLTNCLTIQEDKFGNVWTARPSQGIAVYQPKKGKAKTWLIDKKEIDYGSRAMLKDNNETLWIGTSIGNLVYWDGKHSNDLSSKNFIKIKHPLLNISDEPITFMNQWEDWLILGAGNKVLLFDLNTWYKTKKAIVKYLNPIETSLTSTTEQNTIVTDFRDKTVWFSTSDMLYQWDIENWLKLPNYHVEPKIKIGKNNSFLSANDYNLELKPTQNSFDIEIEYQTKDNMPRYIIGELTVKGEEFIHKNVSLEHKFHYQNLSPGEYIFHLLVCQQDGTYSVFKYPFTIKNFIWQNWWFWAIISIFPIVFIIYYFNNKREKEKKEKEIVQLSINTLSNQFRPHFMLNALNSLGTELDDKPHAEKVISRIGENINLMYDYSQNKKFYIPFKSEWKLVENTIEIQKIIFIKELEVNINGLEIIPENYNVPLGILQVNVENALLHGIRHRKTGPYIITINFYSDDDYYFIDVIDNGVGREKSSKMYDFKRKGTGLKNIFDLSDIINSKFNNGIKISIIDNINNDINCPGTKVQIRILKAIDYEKFKI